MCLQIMCTARDNKEFNKSLYTQFTKLVPVCKISKIWGQLNFSYFPLQT